MINSSGDRTDTPALPVPEDSPIDTGPSLVCGCGGCVSTTPAEPSYTALRELITGSAPNE